MYKTNLKTTILIESDGQLDITNKAQFNQVVMCLKGLAKKLKNHGKGDTEHHEEIDQESLKKIYILGANVLAVFEARNSGDQQKLATALDLLPQGYQNAYHELLSLLVQFLITLLDIRRGKMTKLIFLPKFQFSNHKYIFSQEMTH